VPLSAEKPVCHFKAKAVVLSRLAAEALAVERRWARTRDVVMG
jgi:hypothetical protein